MRRSHSGKTAAAIGLLAGLAIVLAACGGGSGEEAATATPGDGGGVGLGSVAPDTFLTFQGARYRLVDLLQANLVETTSFEAIGRATQADIDQADLTVYRRTGDAEAVYTYAATASPGDASSAAEEDGATTPALWYRWLPEP